MQQGGKQDRKTYLLETDVRGALKKPAECWKTRERLRHSILAVLIYNRCEYCGKDGKVVYLGAETKKKVWDLYLMSTRQCDRENEEPLIRQDQQWEGVKSN